MQWFVQASRASNTRTKAPHDKLLNLLPDHWRMWKSLQSWHQTMLPFLWVFQQKIVLKHLSDSSTAKYDCFQNSGIKVS